MRFKFQELTAKANYSRKFLCPAVNGFYTVWLEEQRKNSRLKTKQMLYSKKNRNIAAKEKAKAAIHVLEDIIYIVFVACKANYLPSPVSDNLL